MNDLTGLRWTDKPKPAASQKQSEKYPAASTSTSYTSLQPTPTTSGRGSLSTTDSFANLVSFGAGKSGQGLSLGEQQKRLAEQKARQVNGQRETLQSQWLGDDEVWNNLGSGRSTPAPPGSSAGQQPAGVKGQDDDEDDLFAAFNKPATAVVAKSEIGRPLHSQGDDHDDDPFGLAQFATRTNGSHQSAMNATSVDDGDDDDFLGDLGRPVQEIRPAKAQAIVESKQTSDHPQDRAIAELLDMGFPADKARQALETTESGVDVQAAVSYLLNQAHAEAQEKTKRRRQPVSEEQTAPRQSRGRSQDTPQVMDEIDRRDRSSTPSNDAAKMATELGATFIKSAGSFWKQAQKQVQQAVSEFNSDSDSSQPKWMTRDVSTDQGRRRRSSASKPKTVQVTDEAAMLEQERPAMLPRPARARPEIMFDSSADVSRDHSPVMPSRLRQSHSPQNVLKQTDAAQDPMRDLMRPRTQPLASSSRATLNRQAAEDQATQAYTSSARRRKPPPAVPASDSLVLEGDLLDGASQSPQSTFPPRFAPSRTATTATKSQRPQPPVQPRPPPPTRNLPSVNALALKSSHTARKAGNTAFKLGDYTAAYTQYTTSLRHLPSTHTIVLPLLTNRALTSMKLGDPKSALVDADAALILIGPSKGDGEVVDLQSDPSDATKPMRDYYAKAIQRKAEALEQLERWPEAAVVWKVCVEDGVGGATAVQARSRAEKTAAPKPVHQKPPSSVPRPATFESTSTAPAEAVRALRAANAAADRTDDEKFALADSVSSRIDTWKSGREGNLRALLASLDTVLWPEAGWKKLSMADLVLVPKVKIHYMKGIARCHPDKVSFLHLSTLPLFLFCFPELFGGYGDQKAHILSRKKNKL